MNDIFAIDLPEDRAALFGRAIGGDKQAIESFSATLRGSSLKTQNFGPSALGQNSKQPQKKIAAISISGAIDYKAGMWAKMFGAVDVLEIGDAIRAAAADPAVSTLILDWDSPGGGIFGVPELSDAIYNLRQSGMRVVSYLNPYALSAGYWLASAASEVYMLSSGYAGSVGAYVMHTDLSGALEEAGIKITFIKAGEKKVDGNRFEPLSSSALEDIQKDVDASYNLFVAHVARNRGKTEAEVVRSFGKGSAVRSEEALAAGMVDGILTFDQLLSSEMERIESGQNEMQFYNKAKLFIHSRR